LEHHTQYGKYCGLKLEAGDVGIAVASAGEVPGRKGVCQENNNNNNNNNRIIINATSLHSKCATFPQK
jgi:hypothetical protein